MKEHKIPLHEKYVRRNLQTSQFSFILLIACALALLLTSIWVRVELPHNDTAMVLSYISIAMSFILLVSAKLVRNRMMSLKENAAIMRKLEQMGANGAALVTNPTSAVSQPCASQPVATGGNTMSDERPIVAINRSLRVLTWFLAPCAVVCVILGILIIITAVKEIFPAESVEEYKVVVSRFDLSVGDELIDSKLVIKTVASDKLPVKPVYKGYGYIVLGHKIVRPVARGQVLDWYDTDIPKVENKPHEAKQVTNHPSGPRVPASP